MYYILNTDQFDTSNDIDLLLMLLLIISQVFVKIMIISI